MVGRCAKNGTRSPWARTALIQTPRGSKENGASPNNFKQNATGRDEEVCDLLGKCHRISPRQNDEAPCATMHSGIE